MKTIITSNSRPLRRAFYAFLIAVAALWAMPRSARAQSLYVVQAGNNTVDEYNATTGALINANFIPSSSGQLFAALAVSGNNLFVMTVSPSGSLVSEYDATTGFAINDTQTGSVTTVDGTATVTFTPQFSQIPIVTLSPIVATVASETTTGFVVNSVDPSTGLPVNATFTWVATGGTGSITVLGSPGTFPGFLALSGNELFVSSQLANTVGEYNVTTGVAINASLITGLPPTTTGLALSGNDLFVASLPPNGTVGEYNATTGAAINTSFITGVGTTGLAVSGNNLFVATAATGTVGEYDATTGAAINATFITGLSYPWGIAVASASVVATCPVNVVLLPSGKYMQATFIPPNSSTLLEYAAGCGLDHFDWQQQITTLDSPSPFFPRLPGLIAPQNIASNGSLIATPAFPLYDPPPGSYTYEPESYDPYPFYYPSNFLVPGAYCTLPLGVVVSGCVPIVSSDGTALSFLDDPTDKYLFPGDFIAFKTSLVGVDVQNNPHTLYSWTWNSTFNGTAGGVSQTASVYPIDPGSGTGGVTVTSINGVQLPPVVLSSQIATTASGLTYSGVSQTFNGTVTLSNISSSAISGLLQILFMGMPANVTLVNATSNLSGTPYLTVPAVASLAPGQSVTVSVQFKNPSNATINFTPVIYSGSILGAPTPPSVSCTATPNTLWPPDGKPVSVTVSGIITPGTSSLAPGGTTYAVIDEYGQDQPNGKITLGSGGRYLFQVWLIAARNGNDKDGRTYTILVNAQDALGNVGSCSSVVTVPHDQGH